MVGKRVLLGATMLMMPAVAGAQTVSGLYIGAGAGVNLRAPSAYGYAGNFRQFSGNVVSSEPGAVGVASLGYGFGNGFRAEVEGNFRYNDVSRFKLGGQRLAGASGDTMTYGAMLNVLYDLDLRRFGILDSPITPYVGLGVGVGVSDYDVRGVSSFNNSFAFGQDVYRFRDQSVQVAYQAILGGAYNLDRFVPGLALTTEYRFYGTTDPDLRLNDRYSATSRAQTFGTFTSPAQSFTGNFASVQRAENYNHSFLVGLRYAFNRPAPAPIYVPEPPPVAVRQVARTYLVFFDWNRADLTDRARQIIADAAQNSRTAGTTRLEVAGHADRSGTPAYNLRLSQRRAEVVAGELMRDGVSRAQIVTEAFGESRPLVPTADGVREPQNRRVEIVLR